MLNSATAAPKRRNDSGYVIRLGTAGDAAALARAGAAFFAETFGAANTREDMAAYLTEAFSETRQRSDLSSDNSRVWLAIDGTGQIVGYAHVRLGAPLPDGASIRGERPAEIARLYADRGYHGRGLGAALMATSLAGARAWAADLIWLGVWERNARAIAFYEKHGFRIVGSQQFMLGADRQTDHVMARLLTTEG